MEVILDFGHEGRNEKRSETDDMKIISAFVHNSHELPDVNEEVQSKLQIKVGELTEIAVDVSVIDTTNEFENLNQNKRHCLSQKEAEMHLYYAFNQSLTVFLLTSVS